MRFDFRPASKMVAAHTINPHFHTGLQTSNIVALAFGLQALWGFPRSTLSALGMKMRDRT